MCSLHRAILAEAKRRGLKNVLVFEDDVVFAADAVEGLRRGLAELHGLEATNPWQILYLGGCTHGRELDKVAGCTSLDIAHVTCTHAIAYSNAVYDRILADVPDTPTEVALWLRDQLAIDQYICREFLGKALVLSPSIATQLNLLPYETQFSPALATQS